MPESLIGSLDWSALCDFVEELRQEGRLTMPPFVLGAVRGLHGDELGKEISAKYVQAVVCAIIFCAREREVEDELGAAIREIVLVMVVNLLRKKCTSPKSTPKQIVRPGTGAIATESCRQGISQDGNAGPPKAKLFLLFVSRMQHSSPPYASRHSSLQSLYRESSLPWGLSEWCNPAKGSDDG
jgi:hypothetical protein